MVSYLIKLKISVQNFKKINVKSVYLYLCKFATTVTKPIHLWCNGKFPQNYVKP